MAAFFIFKNMNNKNHDIYSLRMLDFQEKLDQMMKKNRMISLVRLVIFVLAVTLLISFKDFGVYFIFATITIALIPFLFLVKLNVRYALKIRHLKELIQINQNELEAIKGNHSVFYSGKEFIDPDHAYSYDLDIFGQESIYQLINRTCTGGGASYLARALNHTLGDRKTIIQRQHSIKELSGLLDWRQNFQATGNIVMESEDENPSSTSWFKSNSQYYSNDSKFHQEIITWLKEPFLFLDKKIISFLLYLLPAISIVLFSLMLAGFVPIMGFILFGLVQLLFTGSYLKRINAIQSQIGRKVQLLNKYESLLKIIENKDYKAEILTSKKQLLVSKHGKASKAIEQLKSLVKALDNRNNILFIFLANAYLSWDIQVVLRMEKWKKDHLTRLPEWLDVIYEFDFLSSYAAFSYNHPEYVFPEITEGEFQLDIKQGGHPLINSAVRIDNDLLINGHKQLLVITGANMAGKSTFLRTVGVNMVLALSGSVVCAKELTISPIQLHTSVRTSDSVQKSESYFFAELKRLKLIIDRMQNGENLFVIIDEMLRGTNSKDKHHGSEALIEQIIRLNGSGLIATHDIALGSLAEKYPDNIKNYRFEVEIRNNELEFDYLLKTGVSQNLNATFLMKKMGITV